MRNIKIQSRIQDYSIVFQEDIKDLKQCINNFDALIVDKNILDNYPFINHQKTISVNCIESNKTLDGCSVVLSELINHEIKSNSHILAVGGGILQDIAGFCSSVFCRGISYTLVPTTLLSQADSCIGGKTSINFGDKKNILGTFYPPKEIIIMPAFLNTISHVDYISGLGEIYKFAILQNKINSFDTNGKILDMIYDSLLFKSSILQKDEFDTNERKQLNFGHSIGHAIESYSNYYIPHGIAVTIGCMIESSISNIMGYCNKDIETIIEIGRSLIKMSNLTIDPSYLEFDNLLPYIKADKKNTNNHINMVLIDKEPFIFSFSSASTLCQKYQQAISKYPIL